ncbi:MAG: NYN domain-containing protein, partial [Elusimicrobia bacterium]|nr:NYN domain-containing protein [Elusimicrobiota bacterium]
MYYIVDGYNVINSDDMFAARTLEARRDKLVEFIKVNRSHGNARNKIAVVFDYNCQSSESSGGYNKTNSGEVEIIYSQGRLSADDVIADIAENHPRPYEITVITNDKGIRRRIATLGVKFENVETFLSRSLKDKIPVTVRAAKKETTKKS